jgi:hypothetical protein
MERFPTNEGFRLDRREFTVKSVLALLSGVVITITGCGSDTPGGPSPDPEPGDAVGAISANHGHTAVITSAQLASPTSISLDIQGSAAHSHTVALTQAEVGQVANGARVSKLSSNDQGHSHTVTFN